MPPPEALEIKRRWGQGSGPCVRQSGGLQTFSQASGFPPPGLLASADAFLWELSEKGNGVPTPEPPSWAGGIQDPLGVALRAMEQECDPRPAQEASLSWLGPLPTPWAGLPWPRSAEPKLTSPGVALRAPGPARGFFPWLTPAEGDLQPLRQEDSRRRSNEACETGSAGTPHPPTPPAPLLKSRIYTLPCRPGASGSSDVHSRPAWCTRRVGGGPGTARSRRPGR